MIIPESKIPCGLVPCSIICVLSSFSRCLNSVGKKSNCLKTDSSPLITKKSLCNLSFTIKFGTNTRNLSRLWLIFNHEIHAPIIAVFPPPVTMFNNKLFFPKIS